MAYLLRYCHYPVTATELRKIATTKHFPRLVDYFQDLPDHTTYASASEALSAFKVYGAHNSYDQ